MCNLLRIHGSPRIPLNWAKIWMLELKDLHASFPQNFEFFYDQYQTFHCHLYSFNGCIWCLYLGLRDCQKFRMFNHHVWFCMHICSKPAFFLSTIWVYVFLILTFLLKADCKFGSINCNFAHSEEELRTVQENLAEINPNYKGK